MHPKGKTTTNIENETEQKQHDDQKVGAVSKQQNYRELIHTAQDNGICSLKTPLCVFILLLFLCRWLSRLLLCPSDNLKTINELIHTSVGSRQRAALTVLQRTPQATTEHQDNRDIQKICEVRCSCLRQRKVCVSSMLVDCLQVAAVCHANKSETKPKVLNRRTLQHVTNTVARARTKLISYMTRSNTNACRSTMTLIDFALHESDTIPC